MEPTSRFFEKSLSKQVGAKDSPRWAIVDEFNESYYSGLDVSVYFGGIYIEEITQFQYQEMEQVRPIYGYASYTPSIITHGTRLTQGSFVLNFKDANYFKVLMNYINSKETAASLEDAFQKGYADRRLQNSTLLPSIEPSKSAAALSTYHSVTTDLTLTDIIRVVSTKQDKGYVDLVSGLSTRYWQAPAGTKANLKNTANHTKFAPKGLDLGFDIMIKYGQPDDKGETAYGSVKLLRDCHISGSQQVIDDSGRNIAESYTFLCSTVD